MSYFMAVVKNRRSAWICALLLLMPAAVAARPRLPVQAPVPAANPQQPEQNEATKAEEPPATAPVPEPRPQAGPSRKEQQGPPAPEGSAPKIIVPPHPTRSATQDAQCLDALGKLGVTFTTQPPISDPLGCAVASPVLATNLGKIAMKPEALLDCPMALATARFVNDVVAPEAKRDLGSDLVAIDQASAYVCRPRHGTEKLSEHAFGNALDISTFILKDGRSVSVRAGATGAEATFLDQVRKAACGPFKTVLGPGSDADHALHFHVDLAYRRSGSTFCQ